MRLSVTFVIMREETAALDSTRHQNFHVAPSRVCLAEALGNLFLSGNKYIPGTGSKNCTPLYLFSSTVQGRWA